MSADDLLAGPVEQIDVPHLAAEHRAACDEIHRLRTTLATARHTADHWRRWALDYGDRWTTVAHALCCVLTALDGETRPEHLGIADREPTAPAWTPSAPDPTSATRKDQPTQ